jgi:hypothetical protein
VLSARTGLQKWTAIVATKTEKMPGIVGANEWARSGIGFSLADESEQDVSVQSTLHRIKYFAIGAIMSSKSDETRHNCGHAAKSYAELCNAWRVSILSGEAGHDSAIRSADP